MLQTCFVDYLILAGAVAPGTVLCTRVDYVTGGIRERHFLQTMVIGAEILSLQGGGGTRVASVLDRNGKICALGLL
jgi:hypothetical protein